MPDKKFDVQKRVNSDRWVIVDLAGKLLDDAQGYGYKSHQNAIKAGWYKFGGGKEKIEVTKKRAKDFWNRNKDFEKKVIDFEECCFKEILRGERDSDEEIRSMALEMGIQDFDVGYLEHL